MVVSAPLLRGYQTGAIGKISEKFREGKRRVILQAATGSGKTVMACEMIRRAVANSVKVVFFAHRRRLVDQAGARLADFDIGHGVIMAGYGYGSGGVQVCSRDTILSRSFRNEWKAPPPAGLVIVDECHNAKSPAYKKILDYYHSQKARIVGLSATPAYPDGKGLGRFFDDMVVAEPTTALVRQGFLVPVRCFAPDRAGYRRGKAKLTGDPVAHWKRLAEDRPTVLFTTRVSASKAVTGRFVAAGVPAAHIDAHTPDHERQKVYDDLSAGRLMVVSNCGVWTEGCDLPALSCCILFRNVGSCVLYLQAVGRIMRPHPSKTDAVVIDHSGAVFKYGFPDEDFPWSLDGDTVDRKVHQLKKNKQRRGVIACPQCSFLFSGGQRCPACGHVLSRQHTPVAVRHAHLLEVRRGQSPQRRLADAVKIWREVLYSAAWLNQKMGAVVRRFSSRYGAPPWEVPGLPDVPPPGPDWSGYVREVLPRYAPRGHRHD